MATVVDSLVVTLGLDPSGFQKGAATARAEVKRTREETVTAAKQIEAAGAQAAGFFNKLRQNAVALLGVVAGGTGLAAFASNLQRTAVNVGFLSKNIGTSVASLRAWEINAERFGGTAEAAGAAILGFSQNVEEMRLTGTSSIAGALRAMGVGLGTVDQMFVSISRRFDTMSQQERVFFGRMLGLDMGTINFLSSGSANVEREMAEQQRRSAAMQAYSDKAIEFNKVLVQTKDAIQQLAYEAMGALTPALTKLLDQLQAFLADPEKMEKFRSTAVALFEGVASAVGVAWDALNKLQEGLGGWDKLIYLIGGLKLLGSVGGVVAGGALAAGAVGGAASGMIKVGGWVSSMLAAPTALAALAAVGIIGGLGAYIHSLIQADPKLAEAVADAPGAQAAGEGGLWTGIANGAGAVAGGIRRFLGIGGGGMPGAGRAPQVGPGGAANAKTAMDYFMSKEGGGWTKEQAAGLVANLHAESNFNPAAVGDGGKAQGIAQWHPARQADFLRVMGKPLAGSSYAEQLAFVNWELQNTENAAGQALRGATTARAAGSAVSRLYERPADTVGEAIKRAGSAEGFSNSYVPTPRLDSTTTPAPTPGVTGSPMGDQSSNSMSIGTVVVNTQATDAAGIARDIGQSLREYAYVPDANYGLA